MHWLKPPFLTAQPSNGMDQQMSESVVSPDSFVSPASFRLQMEGLANQYESLHAFSQALIDRNPVVLDQEMMDADGDVPQETSPLRFEHDKAPLWIQGDKVEDITEETVHLQIIDECPQQTVRIYPCEAASDGVSDTAVSDQQFARQVSDEQLADVFPRISVNSNVDSTVIEATTVAARGARSSIRSSTSSLSSDAKSYVSERRSSYENALGGLFTKWFDPGNDSEAMAKYESVMPKDSINKFAALQYDFEEDEQSDSCTLSPVGSKRLTWDFVAFLCLLIELWITPFELVFLEACEPPQAFEIVSYIITGFFSADIILNFFTGFVEGDKTIMTRYLIFRQYMRFWFWVDLVATVPLELLLNAASGGAFSVARLGKASKVVKTLRYLKLLRVARLLRVAQQASSVASHFRFFDSIRHLLVPVGVIFFLMVYAHIHGCIWAFLQPDWVAVDSPAAGLERYFESFWWAYTAVTAGSVGYVGFRDTRTQDWGIFLLEMMISTERLFLGVFGSLRVLSRALRYIDQARVSNARADVLAYLRKNKVSFPTQIQVMFCLTDADRASTQQRFFNAMTEEQLPQELHRTICTELWNSKLMTLGMIAEISTWHINFTVELAQLVREETLPSKAILFNVGDPAVAAYHVIDGELSVKHAPGGRKMPNFKVGMWVGENSLASSFLRCPATFVTANVTSLMALRGESFEETLSNLGLTERFQKFCGEQLWRGLCGRCGLLGDHFSDSCRSAPGKPVLANRTSKPSGISRQRSFNRGSSKMELSQEKHDAHNSKEEVRALSRDLQKYLSEADLSWISDHLLDMEIYDLSDLECLDRDSLRDSIEVDLSNVQKHALSVSEIRKFRERQASDVHRALFQSVSRLHHLVFLSHYKVEAGTEAALLRTEIEQVIAKNAGSLGHRFEQPVFLDSDDLTNLEELKERVCHTHNLVLLLTKGVLTRPWCIIEILTAWREGVRVQPVIITKPGNNFEFPNEAFYRSLRSGGVLDMQAVEVIKQHGFSIQQVELAIQNVFQQIAVPYSPHKAKNIRQAEVDKLMKNCRLKSDHGNDDRPSERKKKSVN